VSFQSRVSGVRRYPSQNPFVLRRGCRIWASRAKLTLATLLTCLAFCLTARAEVLVSRYVVNIDGLRIGDAILRTTLDAKHYKTGVSADIGMLLASTQIQGEASGTRSGARLTPEHFQIVMTGSEPGAIEVNFANSAEAAADGNARLKGYFDPLSALLVASLKPSSPSNHPCNFVLPIFTGRERLELKLRPKAAGLARGEPAVCRATAFDPLAGGSGPSTLDLEITFTKVAKPHFWLVEHISIPTAKGIVTIVRAETSISGS
jgi:hypothetical protein